MGTDTGANEATSDHSAVHTQVQLVEGEILG